MPGRRSRRRSSSGTARLQLQTMSDRPRRSGARRSHPEECRTGTRGSARRSRIRGVDECGNSRSSSSNAARCRGDSRRDVRGGSRAADASSRSTRRSTAAAAHRDLSSPPFRALCGGLGSLVSAPSRTNARSRRSATSICAYPAHVRAQIPERSLRPSPALPVRPGSTLIPVRWIPPCRAARSPPFPPSGCLVVPLTLLGERRATARALRRDHPLETGAPAR